VSRLMKFAALLLATLWLPATLHCQLEAAEIHFLTHDHEESEHHDGHDGGPDDEHHAFKDPSVTLTKSVVKILPPGHAQALVLVALLATARDNPTSALSPERHPPPLELKVAWQFMDRAAPPARAPSLNS
jgi:hypothetical protein